MSTDVTEADTVPVGNLSVGSRFIYRDVACEVLRDREDWVDQFGRTMWKFYCRRLDTMQEGDVLYGPTAWVLPAYPAAPA